MPKFKISQPIIKLEQVDRDKFKSPNLASVQDVHLHVNPELMLGNPDGFLLAARSCDGSYHSVHSNINELFKQNAPQIRKGLFSAILKTLDYDEDSHGKRFLIYKKGNKAYLVGDVMSALKRMSGR